MHIPKPTEIPLCYSMSMGGNAHNVIKLKPIIEKCGMKLIIISEWPEADIKWNYLTYLRDLSQADVCICSQNVELQPAKSGNRVALALSLGLPVIASPLPAYLEIIKHNVNGLIASTPKEWEACLLQLKDYNERLRLSQAARESVKDYSPEAIGKRWIQLLSQPLKRPRIAFINNTLPVKYNSYGDYWQEAFQAFGLPIQVFKYDQIDKLPFGFDYYFFLEVRYKPEEISDVHPRILYTMEDQDLNHLPYFDCILTGDPNLADKWYQRGFINTAFIENQPGPVSIRNVLNFVTTIQRDWITKRRQHNNKLHNDHINAFYRLMLPEERWTQTRDKIHLDYVLEKASVGSSILDIGSADGFLSLYLAKQGYRVSAVDCVQRGLYWTDQQAKRLNLTLEIRFGFLEHIDQVFHDKKFDTACLFEIIEHLDLLKIPFYLEKVEKVLNPNGQVLISLPLQDLRDNPEHLFSPSQSLIEKVFKGKKNLEIRWVPMENCSVPGNWFISYTVA